MSGNETLLLVVQLLNTAISLGKQINLNVGSLATRLDELGAEGKNLSVEELHELVSGLRAELDGLEADIEAGKAELPGD